MALSIRDYQGLCAEYEEDIEEKNKELKRLKEIIKCKNVLLVAYRLGTRKGVEKALDRLEALKGE